MKYKNSFYLCACFMMVFILETASERRQKDNKQLHQVQKKIANGLTAEVTRQTERVTRQTELPESEYVKESRAKDRCNVLIAFVWIPGIFIAIAILGAPLMLLVIFIMGLYVSCKKRNKSDHQNKTTRLLPRESNKCDGPELSIRRSFFKKSIDATLSMSGLEKLKKSMQSVGILIWDEIGRGTVIRIEDKYILTAWHVIEPIVSTPGRVDTHGNAINSMNVEGLKDDTVCVDFSVNTTNGESHCQFPLLPKICFLDKSLDVCVLEVDGKVENLPKPIKVFRDFNAMNIGSTHKFVHVIGQHPVTMNIVVDIGCKIILPDDKKVKRAKKWIKKKQQEILRHTDMERDLQQTYDEVSGTGEHLTIDTFLEFGASGGAVVSFTLGGEVALVAILMRGLPSWFWDNGSRERGFKSFLRMEVACPITEILSSKEWRDSEKERIFGQLGHIGSPDYRVDKMETDQSTRGAFDVTTYDTYADGNAMETDQLERDAVDNKMSQMSLEVTC